MIINFSPHKIFISFQTATNVRRGVNEKNIKENISPQKENYLVKIENFREVGRGRGRRVFHTTAVDVYFVYSLASVVRRAFSQAERAR